MKLVSLIVPLAFASAYADPQDTSSDQQQSTQFRHTAIATITNMLPVDGCSYPITIGDVQYAPDPQSLDAISDLVPAGGTIRARIRYDITGRTGQVECGFGTTQQLPEISVRVVRVLPTGSESQDTDDQSA